MYKHDISSNAVTKESTMSMSLIEVKSENRFGLEYFVVCINGVEHASFWSPQKAEQVAKRLLNKVKGV